MRIDDILTINHFIDTYANEEMPINVAYKFTKIAAAIQDDLTFFKEKYGEILAGAEDPTNLNEAEVDAVNKLLQVEVTTTLPKFKIEDLGAIMITPAKLANLYCIIED